MLSMSTFSVTGGLAAEYIERGEMIPWSGVIAVEGLETGDSRGIAPGALEWREPPLPFMVQLENPVGGDGHDGAKLGGRVDTIERRDGEVEGTKEIFATGFVDPTITPDARTFAEALDRGIMRGVSIDVDKVATFDVAASKGSGARQIITSGRIMGLTGTPFQAFTEAFIGFDLDRMSPLADALAASGEAEGMTAFIWSPCDSIETLVASGGSTIPVAPPAEWFEKPSATELTPLTVLSNGRVFGHIAAWGTCHISFAGRCVPVPRSQTNYAAFRNGSVVTGEGNTVRTGPIVMDTVHPDLRWRASDAQAFYADTSSAVADVVPYEDKFGIWVSGAMRPDVSPARLRAFRGSDISPDWRTVDGRPRECVALLAVNNSGFKMPQSLAASAGMAIMPGEIAVAMDHDEVYALVASGALLPDDCDECPNDVVEVFTADGSTIEVAVEDVPDEGIVDAVVELAREERIARISERFGPKVRRFHMARKPAVRTFKMGASR